MEPGVGPAVRVIAEPALAPVLRHWMGVGGNELTTMLANLRRPE
ncbi:hypothetical protein MPS_3705 [Mycobacterium pseudoshottsii JCM 15466]|nr:hypothetical protein MPS_3705 [Mycobacterium pseudoshottsii JCM 15466]